MPNSPDCGLICVSLILDAISQSTCLRCHVWFPIKTTVTVELFKYSSSELLLDFQKNLIEIRKMCFDKPLSKKELSFDPSEVKFQIIGSFLYVKHEDSDDFLHYFLRCF
jgi:hypothetical protein